LPHHLVVDVDTDHRIGTKGGGALFQLVEGDLAGTGQLFFIGAGAAADDVADPGKEILEKLPQLPENPNRVVTCTTPSLKTAATR